MEVSSCLYRCKSFTLKCYVVVRLSDLSPEQEGVVRWPAVGHRHLAHDQATAVSITLLPEAPNRLYAEQSFSVELESNQWPHTTSWMRLLCCSLSRIAIPV